MIAPGQPITTSDLDAFAASVNSKLPFNATYGEDCAFNVYDSTIGQPTNLACVVSYVPGSDFPGDRYIRVQAYVLDGGRKKFGLPSKPFGATATASGTPTFTFSWDAVPDADGYVVSIGGPQVYVSTYHYWEDIGNVTSYAGDGVEETNPLDNWRLRFEQSRNLLRDLHAAEATIAGPHVVCPSHLTHYDFGGVSIPTADASILYLQPRHADSDDIWYMAVRFAFSTYDVAAPEVFNGFVVGTEPDFLRSYVEFSGGYFGYGGEWLVGVAEQGAGLFAAGFIYLRTTFEWQGGGAPPAAIPTVTFGTNVHCAVSQVSATGDGNSFELVLFVELDGFVSGDTPTPFDIQFQLFDGATDVSADYDAGAFGQEWASWGFFSYDGPTTDNEDLNGIVPVSTDGSALKQIAAPDSTISETLYCKIFSVVVDLSSDETLRLPHGLIARNGDLPCRGLWLAETFPPAALHGFIDQDLPQYLPPLVTEPSSRRKQSASPASSPVKNSVPSRDALWPVFRDTDFGMWKPDHFGYVRPIPYWRRDAYQSFVYFSETLQPGQTFSSLVLLPDPYFICDLQTENPALKIFVDQDQVPDPESPPTYSFTAAGHVRIPDDVTMLADAGFNFTIWNDSLVAVEMRLMVAVFTADYGRPQFVSVGDGLVTEPESFSFKTTESTAPLLETPLRIPPIGYEIRRVTARRNGTSGDLEIKIGIMLNAGVPDADTVSTPGEFFEFETITILDGESSAAISVFLPVLEGSPLAYQCGERVVVEAEAFFMPLIFCTYSPDGSFLSAESRWAGQPRYEDRFCRATNSYSGINSDAPDYANAKVHWPLSAELVNALTAALDEI